MRVKLILPKAEKKASHPLDFRFLSSLLSPLTGDKEGAVIMGAMPLALPTIAALTPPDVEVTLTDENIEPIDYDDKVDIVGISFLSFAADRAYEIASEFRRKGVYVVFGGVHASILPHEAQPHADTLFIGEAEDTWPQFIEDFRNQTPKKTYKTVERPDLRKRVIPRWDLLKNRAYYTYHVQTTRGCSFDCDFCCVREYQGRPRSKPLENVLAEIREARRYARTGGVETIVFADDNILSSRTYANELFKALIPLQIQWSAQCSLNIAQDDELLDLAQESGCQSLLMGFESLSQESLQSINKGRVNKAREFEAIIEKIHSRKINVVCMIVLGLDGDDETIFDRTSRFLRKTSVAYPLFNILTPVPGTRLYGKLEKEGRLLHSRWVEYNGSTVCYRPLNMSIDTLRQGYYWIVRNQYSLEAIRERIQTLWDKGIIAGQRNKNLTRVALTILLLFRFFKEKGEMAKLLKETIRMIWTRKGINLDVLLLSLNYFDFARNLPVPKAAFRSREEPATSKMQEHPPERMWSQQLPPR